MMLQVTQSLMTALFPCVINLKCSGLLMVKVVCDYLVQKECDVCFFWLIIFPKQLDFVEFSLNSDLHVWHNLLELDQYSVHF